MSRSRKKKKGWGKGWKIDCPPITAQDRLAKSERDRKANARTGMYQSPVKSSTFARWNGGAAIESARAARRHGVG